MIPMPQRITTVHMSWQGVTLAETLDGFFVVGLDYLPGVLLTSWDPRTDYCGTKDIVDAKRMYFEYSGHLPHTTLPIATEDNDREEKK